MKCRECQNKIYFFLEGELKPEENATMQEHISSCKSCRELHNQIKATLTLMEEEKKVKINPFFYTRLQERIKKEEPVYVRKPSLARTLKLIPVPLLTIIGLVIGIVLGNSYYNQLRYVDTTDRAEKIESLKETYFWSNAESESLAYNFYNIENEE